MKDAINKTYNKSASVPAFTCIVVNKTIQQRFFAINGKSLDNPPPGTIIDKSVTLEKNAENKSFDFYLIS